MNIQNLWIFVRNYVSDTKAAIMPMVALSIATTLGMTAVGVDASYWMAKKNKLQIAVDAAAIAAGWEAANDSMRLHKEKAIREAQNNGYEPERNGIMDIQISLTPKNEAIIDVTISQEVDTWFSNMFLKEPMRIATTASVMVGGFTGEFCLLSLDRSASGALTTSGAVEINSSECGIAVNSSSPSSFTMSGDASVDIDILRMAGGYNISGGSADLTYNAIFADQAPMEDPYADLDVPAFDSCSQADKKKPLSINENGKVILDPGVYCGGINITGTNDVVFRPGIYILDGGDFSVSGGGSLSGDDVSFVLAGSHNDHGQLDISGSRAITFSAPPEGEEMEGIVFYQDRNAGPAKGGQANKLTGSSELVIDGVVYIPEQTIEYGGGYSTESRSCSKVIGKKIILSGSPLLNNDCEDKGIRPMGMNDVRLIF